MIWFTTEHEPEDRPTDEELAEHYRRYFEENPAVVSVDMFGEIIARPILKKGGKR